MSHRDRLPGGLADRRHPSDFDRKELARGVKVELEHTNDPEIAREIAMDHLEEDEAYYEKLDALERGTFRMQQNATKKKKASRRQRFLEDYEGLSLSPKEKARQTPFQEFFTRLTAPAPTAKRRPQSLKEAQAWARRESIKKNPEDCPECYAENQLGGASTALVIGGLTLLGLFLFTRRSDAKAALPTATCTVQTDEDLARLDRWGNARGFPVFYFAGMTTPPTAEEFFSVARFGQDRPSLAPGEQAVAVLSDGSFWYYTQSEISGFPLTGRADNLRADYCSFPETEPPLAPPPPPTT